MRGRVTSILAWASLPSSALLWAATLLLWARTSGAGADAERDPIGLLVVIFVAMLIFAGMGGVIASQRPRNPIGWIFAAVAFLVSVRGMSYSYVVYGHITRHGRVPLWEPTAWLSNWIWIVAIGTSATFLLLLFPTGRPPSPRWRIVGWTAAIAMGAAVASVALAPGPLDDFPYITNPFGVPPPLAGVIAAMDAGFPLLLASTAAAVTSLVVRSRRAGYVEREQIKWVAFAGSFLAIALPLVTLVFAEFTFWPALMLFGPLSGFAIASALAIQRYRLFDIDRIISRTVGYAIVTAVLGGLFVVIALLPTAIVGSGDAPDWLIAVATLLVFALFRPLRRRVQQRVDRRFNRARYDAARTIEAFSARLREETDLDSLRAELTGIVNQTMQPTRVSLWLRSEA